jgi:hypothetical protein
MVNVQDFHRVLGHTVEDLVRISDERRHPDVLVSTGTACAFGPASDAQDRGTKARFDSTAYSRIVQ